MASDKRRACHTLLSCDPATTEVFSGSSAARTNANTALGGTATVLGNGNIVLVNPAEEEASNDSPERGSAFHTTKVSLMEGFESTFTFEFGLCLFPPNVFGNNNWHRNTCDDDNDEDAGFAFVVQNQAANALGDAGETLATSFLGGGSFTNYTRVSAAGYGGIKDSFGLIFSVKNNQLFSLDWKKGAMGLYVDGNVTVNDGTYGPARAVSQWTEAPERGFEAGPHTARVVYHAAARMLYLYVDNSSEPYLWGSLHPEEVGLGADGLAWVGFTATSGVKAQAVTVSSWSVGTTATHVASSALLEANEIVTSVDIEGHVHIDARDSCGLPRPVGGDAWSATISQPDGGSLGTMTPEDLTDGTYRVPVLSSQSGMHTLTATLGGQSFSASFTVDP